MGNDDGFKLAYSPAEAAKAMSLSESSIYELMAEGRLERCKIGRRTLIPRYSLEALLREGSQEPGGRAQTASASSR